MIVVLLQIIFSLFFITVFTQRDEIYVQNLDEKCLRCLCFAATNCDVTLGCNDDYCGPYKMSKDYWIDGGRAVKPEDDPDRFPAAYEDCALNLICSHKVIKNYMAKYGRDCNGDGVTNCLDYLLININGGLHCHTNLDRNEEGRNWTKRYTLCSPSI